MTNSSEWHSPDPVTFSSTSPGPGAYDSVRRRGGQAVAVFYPDLVSPAVQGPHLHYHWDGERISHYSVVKEIVPL